MKKTRLGILMDRLECEPNLFDLITNLAKDPNIELFLLQNKPQIGENQIKKIRNLINEEGFLRFIGIAFFIFIMSCERKIILLRGTSTDFSKQFLEKRLDAEIFAGTILLTPIFSKTMFSGKNVIVSYSDVDIKKIHQLGLDLILRGHGRGIYQGKILSTSNKGILSFHHGDNIWNHGDPAGFWEIYLKKPTTGFTIKILNERSDNDDVIFKGEVPTLMLYTINFVNILQTGYPFMERIIKSYASTGTFPQPLPKTPYSNMLFTIPKVTETFTYVVRTAFFYSSNILIHKVLKRDNKWSVAFIRSNWMTANLSMATIVKNPQGRYFADPFVAICDNQTVMFVEDYHLSSGQGTISAIKISPNGSYEILPDIVKEDFHLSFPYLFEYRGTLYMVPESLHPKSIRLYKCVQFPNRWEYQYEIMQGVNASDTMVFEHLGRWWLLTTMGPDGSSGQSAQLCAYSATSPLSKDWQPHPKNPVCFSSEFGRNGGLLRDADGTLFCVMQKQGFNQYGMMFTIAKITRLDMENYEVVTYCEVEPKFFPGLIGTHTMHCNGEITVFDFLKEKPEPIR